MADSRFVFERRFWNSHVVWPALGFACALALIGMLDLDRNLSHAVFYDAASKRWLGAEDGLWWARDLIHTGGGWLVRVLAGVAVVVWLGSFAVQRLRDWRRAAGFAVVALALSTGIVSGLKAVTNVDCPWDLSEFGGDRPYVGLFSHRPGTLPRAKCFPGGHASSGFALVFGYFVFRDRSRRIARIALAAAIVLGATFSFGQQARGAHFLSHDLTSAALVWFVQLGLYVLILRTWTERRPSPNVLRPFPSRYG